MNPLNFKFLQVPAVQFYSTHKSQVYFVAVILKVLLVNMLSALNFANVFKNKKNVSKIKKRYKT